jgi:hypothetical protein
MLVPHRRRHAEQVDRAFGRRELPGCFPGISGRSSELLFNKRGRYFGESEVLAVPGEVKPHGDVHRDLFVRGHGEYRTMASNDGFY